MKTRIAWILVIALLSIGFAMAVPGGTDPLNPISSEREPAAGAQTLDAQAGNVTELNINGTSITQTWQGYFGNITGKIVLGDANNNSLYDWNLASPNGEIYATRTSSVPDWSSIICADEAAINAEDDDLGVNQTTDADSVNRTFLQATSHPGFFVGTVQINADACYATHLYNDTGAQDSQFAEVILSDTTDIIYTTLLESDILGFNGRTHDFEMLVGEDGHGAGSSTTTSYYFYVELE